MILMKTREGHAHVHLDFLQLAFQLPGVGNGLLALAAGLVQAIKLVLRVDELVMVMLADGDKFLGHLLLVIEADE